MKTLLLSLLLISTPAFANGNLGDVNEDNAERTWQAICQPGSYEEAELSPEDREVARFQRRNYVAFLDQPEATVAKLMSSALVDKTKRKGLSLGDQLALVFEYAATCEASLAMAHQLTQHGCNDEKGVRHDASQALELCGELADSIRRSR